MSNLQYPTDLQSYLDCSNYASVKRSNWTGKIAYETYLHQGDTNGTANPLWFIRYHATDIVTFYQNGRTVFNHGGWRTSTTKARISDHMPKGWYLNQERGEWILTIPKVWCPTFGLTGGAEYVVGDGFILDPAGWGMMDVQGDVRSLWRGTFLRTPHGVACVRVSADGLELCSYYENGAQGNLPLTALDDCKGVRATSEEALRIFGHMDRNGIDLWVRSKQGLRGEAARLQRIGELRESDHKLEQARKAQANQEAQAQREGA